MGKTAKNEILKIRAAFANNVAVGLLIAGFLVPYFAFVSRYIEQRVLAGFPEEMELGLWNAFLATLIAMAIAGGLSYFARWRARQILEGIED